MLEGFAGGAALAATSLGTTLSLLSSESDTPKTSTSPSKDIRRSRIGSVLLAAALIDDIIGLILVSIIPSLHTPSGSRHSNLVEVVLRPLGVSIGLFLLIEIRQIRSTVTKTLAYTIGHFRMRGQDKNGVLLLMVALLSAGAAGAYYAGTSMLFGAWLVGVLLGETDRSLEGIPLVDDVDMADPSNSTQVETEGSRPVTFQIVFLQHIAPVQSTVLAPLSSLAASVRRYLSSDFGLEESFGEAWFTRYS